MNAAEIAAGTEYAGLFHQFCDPPAARQQRLSAEPAGDAPDRSTWYAEPVKVFDNLYFVGQSQFSVWAVTTSNGIILVDTIFDYSVEAEVIDGLTKMGLDPTTIRYAIVSHGDRDHAGGAKFLQERFGTRIILGADDWRSIERGPEPKPKRDIVATDGMKVALGDTSLTVYLTPGHTDGTISTLIPVKDNGKPYTAALWGGTLFDYPQGMRTTYAFQTYSNSARKFRDIVETHNVEVLLLNHAAFNESTAKLSAVLARKASAPHPYVVGKESVKRFLTMVDECATAGMLRTSHG